MIQQIDKIFLNRVASRRFIMVVLLAIFCWIDLATGYEYSFSVFYLIPISIAAWYDNKKTSIVMIIASAATWLYADFGSGHQYQNSVIPYWNAFVRLVFFGIVAFLILKIRGNLVAMTLMAMKDNLTLLNNARAFKLEYEFLKGHRSLKKQSLAVGLIDLDGFKSVNDRLGHNIGDEVLVEFAHVLKRATRSSDIIARMGGDEFTVILVDMNEHSAQDYASRLRQEFEESGLRHQYGVDFSMGISIFEQLPENLDDATHHADQLMYRSKEMGKSTTIIQVA